MSEIMNEVMENFEEEINNDLNNEEAVETKENEEEGASLAGVILVTAAVGCMAYYAYKAGGKAIELGGKGIKAIKAKVAEKKANKEAADSVVNGKDAGVEEVQAEYRQLDPDEMKGNEAEDDNK